MPICEYCQKEVKRRETYKDGRKVCPKCTEIISGKEFSLLSEFIITGKENKETLRKIEGKNV